MSMKKLFLVTLMILSVLLCLCACGEGEENPTTDPVSTTAPTEAPTDPTEEPADAPTDPTEPENKPTYTVNVVDENNNPVPGAIVQMCLEACVPGVTNENGVAEFFLAENDYKVSFVNIPAGYELAGEETEFYFADGENTMTIVLKAAA